MNRRTDIVPERVERLVLNFERYVADVDAQVPFRKEGQFERHARTIAMRRSLGSAAAAIADTKFLQSLYHTFQAWGIGVRASRLARWPQFVAALQAFAPGIVALEGRRIDDREIPAPCPQPAPSGP